MSLSLYLEEVDFPGQHFVQPWLSLGDDRPSRCVMEQVCSMLVFFGLLVEVERCRGSTLMGTKQPKTSKKMRFPAFQPEAWHQHDGK